MRSVGISSCISRVSATRVLITARACVHRRADFIIKIIIKMCSRNSNAKSLRPFAESRNIIAYRNIRAVHVERIVSRNRLQHNRRIADGRSQRPHMIQRPRKRNHSARRNAPISRLDPNTSAQRRRFANGASRIGPNRRDSKARQQPRPPILPTILRRYAPRSVDCERRRKN